MKTNFGMALTLLVGVGIGAATVQGLHAQAKPPAYVITEVEIINEEAFKGVCTEGRCDDGAVWRETSRAWWKDCGDGRGSTETGGRIRPNGRGAILDAPQWAGPERPRAYSKNVTPKYRPKRQSAGILLPAPVSDTETQRCVRNVRHIAAFRARPDSVCVRDRLSAWGGGIRTCACRVSLRSALVLLGWQMRHTVRQATGEASTIAATPP
jgi:hypothetical protein